MRLTPIFLNQTEQFLHEIISVHCITKDYNYFHTLKFGFIRNMKLNFRYMNFFDLVYFLFMYVPHVSL